MKNVTRKDIIFGFITFDLIGFICFLIVWKLGTTQDIVNQLSLASSISSILLALVAIIYAYMQTNETSRQNMQVQDALNKITEKVESVVLIRNEFESFREDNKLNNESMIKQIEGIRKSFEPIENLSPQSDPGMVQETVKKQMEIINEQLNELKGQVELEEKELYFLVRRLINNNYGKEELFTFPEFLRMLNKNNLSLDRKTVTKLVNRLVSTDYLQTESKNEINGNGTVYFKRAGIQQNL